MISDQNCTTRSSITTLLLKSQFEIAEFSQYQYLIDLLAGSLKSGNKNLLHLCISLRGRRFKREGKGSFGKGSLYLFWNHTRDFNIERVRSASSIWNHKYELRPKLNGTKFNYNLITSILPAVWFVTLNEIWNLFGCAVLLSFFTSCEKDAIQSKKWYNLGINHTVENHSRISRIASDFEMDIPKI